VKRWLAYFFLVIFSFQPLPVKAIGKLIAKRQMTEEVKNDCDDDDDAGDDSDDDTLETLKEACLHHHSNDIVGRLTFALSAQLYRQGAEDLPSAHVKDIHCPPPNC